MTSGCVVPDRVAGLVFDADDELAADLSLPSSRTILHATELTDEASILDLAVKVRDAWQAPDIVVNNAGLYPRCGLIDLPAADWDRIFAVNLRAPFLVRASLTFVTDSLSPAIVTWAGPLSFATTALALRKTS